MHCSLSRRCESARRAAGICSRGRLRSTPILLFPPSPHRRGMKKKKYFNLDLALLWLPGRSRQTRCRCRVLPYLGACPAAQTGHSQREFRDRQHTDGGRELVPPSAALCPAWEVTPAPLRRRPALWGPLAAGRGRGQRDGTSRGNHCSQIVPVKPQGEIQSLRSGGESPVGASLVPDPAR